MKKRIGIVTNASKDSGVGSRAFHIAQAIGERDDVEVTLVQLDGNKRERRIPLLTKEGLGEVRREKQFMRLPGLLNSKSISWIRLARNLPEFDVYDISNQTLSFIAKKRHPNIVTVHDIIELTDPQDAKAKLLNQYLLSGIKHADRIVAVSEYTKQSIHEYFAIAKSAITVIPNGVDDAYHEIPGFKSSIAYQELIQKLRISEHSPIILYVGSEHPRKNVKTLLATIAILKKQFPNVLLLKVGDAGLRAGREATLASIDELNVQSHVRLLGNISDELLNQLYNIADALLFPSKNEGFGLPPLQAMAAGCPVVCSNATSLPEVVGDAALIHSPEDSQAFAESIVRIVTDAEFRQGLQSKGKERAQQFTWDTAAQKMLDLYRL